MDTILFQGSGCGIGDIFFSSMPMFHLKKVFGKKIVVALPKNLNREIRELYDHHLFLDGIVELDDIDERFVSMYARDHDMEPSIFLKSIEHHKGMLFYKLSEWFKNPKEPTIAGDNLVAVQIMSSRHWERPKIPHWEEYLEQLLHFGLTPVFMGTIRDEELLLQVYPGIKKYCTDDQYWRFGKDSILQTLSNTGVCRYAWVFSSWIAYAAVSQLKPTFELWQKTQWQYYTPMVRLMLGNPIHYLQDCFDTKPAPSIFLETFPRLESMAKRLYS